MKKSLPKIKMNFKYPSRVFNKHFYDTLYDYSNFTEVYYGGASSGKSHGVVQKVILKALGNWKHPRKILWLRKVAATVKDSIFADVLSTLSDWEILPLCKVNHSNREITLPNGAVFLFKGLDDPEKVKSIKGISDVVMEEASEFNLDDYTQLTLRLRERKHKQKQIFLMFNPVSKVNWVYKTFFISKPKNTVVYQSTYKDNNFLDEQTIENIEDLANRNPSYYKIYALGEFATLDKLVFPKYTKQLLSKEELSHLPSYLGLDFGFTNDPSAFTHTKIDMENKKLYVVEEYVRKGMMNNEIADAIRTLGYSKEVIQADSSEQKSVAELRSLGLNRVTAVRKGPGSVMQGIQFIQQFEIVVDERCVKTIEELENYTWKKDRKSGEYINEPADSYNHCIDSIRYSLQNYIFEKHNKRKKSIKKQIATAKRLF